jgi:xylan 1,4-beta-xylosidase
MTMHRPTVAVRRRRLLPLAPLLAVACRAADPSAAMAQSPATAPARHIVVDASRVVGPHSRTPLRTVGAGRANEGLRADWQAQLDTVQREIGFDYLRFHGLLNDDMGVYTEDAAGQPLYNFQYVDPLYDALLARHIRPFVELSFMPAKLASGKQTVFWWKANVTPPKDLARWDGLVRALVRHWRDRYGEDEVARWYFEVWNEPDLSIFWAGTQQQYFDLYRHTAEAIKAVSPRFRVGGPADASGPIEQPWLQFIAHDHVPADFLSAHSYATTKGAVDVTGTAGTILSAAPDAIVGRVRASAASIAASATPRLELHYTEWSTSYTPTDPVHDQYISAPFILEKLRATSPIARSMSYWTFTDIFEELGPRFTPFHGGFGLMNLQGIRKPSYFAYQFLARLGSTDVWTSDPRTWATTAGDGSVQALFWDYHPTSPPAESSDQVFYAHECPAADLPAIELTVKGLANGSYAMTIYRVGYRQNDAYTAYLRMGSPRQLTRSQVAALQTEASGAPAEARTVKVVDGRLDWHFDIRENDVVLVTVKRQASER